MKDEFKIHQRAEPAFKVGQAETYRVTCLPRRLVAPKRSEGGSRITPHSSHFMNHNHNLLMLKTTPQPPQTLCPPCENGSPEETSTPSPACKNETEFASELRHVANQSEELNAAIDGSTCDLLANWLAPRYLLEVRDQLAKLSKGSDRLKLMHRVIANAVALQRGGYWTPHIQLGRDRLELANEKHRHAVAIAQPAPQKLRDPKQPLSEEDRQAILDKVDEIFGLK